MKSIPTGVKILGVIATLVISFLLWQSYSEKAEVNQQNLLKSDQMAFTRDHITNYVYAERNTYKYSELGGIYGLTITVHNETDYIIDKVVVKVSYLKPSGKVWKDKLVEFDFVGPQKVVENKIADESRGVKIEYKIVSITSRSLGLF